MPPIDVPEGAAFHLEQHVQMNAAGRRALVLVKPKKLPVELEMHDGVSAIVFEREQQILSPTFNSADSCPRGTPIEKAGGLRPHCNRVADPHARNALSANQRAQGQDHRFHFRGFRHKWSKVGRLGSRVHL